MCWKGILKVFLTSTNEINLIFPRVLLEGYSGHEALMFRKCSLCSRRIAR